MCATCPVNMNSIGGGSRFGGNSKVYKCSLSWNHLITRTNGVGFGWDLEGDMCTICAICPVKMSSIGGGSRFGGNSKVYKCSLSWNHLITSVGVDGFWSNLVGDMASVLWYYPVKMSSIGGDCALVATQRYISALWVGRNFKCGLSLFELEIACNSDKCHWIWMRFGRRHVHYVCYLPCKYELNRRHVAFWWQLKGI